MARTARKPKKRYSRTKTAAKIRRVVLYYRMSSDGQVETSEARQIFEAEKYCQENGYEIVERFYDLAISGNTETGRPGFVAMHDYAEDPANEIDAIIVHHKSRYCRLRGSDFGSWQKRLRRAGLALVVTSDRRAWDFTDEGDSMIYPLMQEAEFKALVTIGETTTSGKRKKYAEGIDFTRCPYGFDREYTDETGAVVARCPWNENYRSQSSLWKQRFVEAADGSSDIVRRIFAETIEGAGYRTIANQLTKEGHLPPSGDESKGWNAMSIRSILQNYKYTGASVIGKSVSGRHATLSGEDCPSEDEADAPRILDDSIHGPKIREGYHDQIVTHATFEAATAAVEGRRNKGKPSPAGEYLLTGLVRCGLCGGTMAGHTVRNSTRGPKGSRKKLPPARYYKCSRASSRSDHCSGHSIPADKIEAAVEHGLLWLLGAHENEEGPGFRMVASPAEYREALAAVSPVHELPKGFGIKSPTSEKAAKGAAAKAKTIATKIERLSEEIATQEAKLLGRISARAVEIISAELDRLTEKREKLEDERDQLDQVARVATSSPAEIEKEATLVLDELRAPLDTKKRRRLYLDLIESIPLTAHDITPKGSKRRRVQVEGGLVYLRGARGFCLAQANRTTDLRETIAFRVDPPSNAPRKNKGEKAPSSPRKRRRRSA